MNLKEKLRNGVIYNAAIYGICILGVMVIIAVILLHQMIYSTNWVDRLLLIYVSAVGAWLVLKLYEYCIEHNDDTAERLDDVELRLGKIERAHNMGNDLKERIEGAQ